MSSVRLPVRLSVTLVDQDHIGWKSWKITARTISATSSLFVAQRPSTYSQENTDTYILYRDRGGVWKSGALEHKSVNISEKRKDRGKVTMEGLKELTSAFLKGTILNPLWPPLVQDWGLATPTKNFNPYYPRHNKAIRTSNFVRTFIWFIWSIGTKAH